MEEDCHHHLIDVHQIVNAVHNETLMTDDVITLSSDDEEVGMEYSVSEEPGKDKVRFSCFYICFDY